MKRKLPQILLCALLITVLSSCTGAGQNTDSATSESSVTSETSVASEASETSAISETSEASAAAAGPYMQFIELTPEQKEIARLTCDQDRFFKYTVNPDFHDVEITYRVYHYGECIHTYSITADKDNLSELRNTISVYAYTRANNVYIGTECGPETFGGAEELPEGIEQPFVEKTSYLKEVELTPGVESSFMVMSNDAEQVLDPAYITDSEKDISQFDLFIRFTVMLKSEG